LYIGLASGGAFAILLAGVAFVSIKRRKTTQVADVKSPARRNQTVIGAGFSNGLDDGSTVWKNSGNSAMEQKRNMYNAVSKRKVAIGLRNSSIGGGNAFGTPRSAAGTPRNALGTPRSAPGTPRSSSGTPRSSRGTPRSSRGTPRSSRGTPRSSRGTPRSSCGTPKSAGGTPRSSRGTPSSRDTTRSDSSTPESSPDTPKSARGTSLVQSQKNRSRKSNENDYDFDSEVSKNYPTDISALRMQPRRANPPTGPFGTMLAENAIYMKRSKDQIESAVRSLGACGPTLCFHG